MQRKLLLVCSLLLVLIVGANAQIVDTTVCGVLAEPQAFDGKIVRIKGVVIAGFDDFAIKDTSCKQPVNGIWLSYPEGSKAKSGPVALLQLQLAKNSPATTAAPIRAKIKLDTNKDFKQFDALLANSLKVNGMCLGCTRYTVTATMIGRIDSVTTVGATRDASGKFISLAGFGNMNRYPARLVLQSVSEIAGQEIDYSQAASVTKGDSVRESAGDPVAAAHKAAQAFGAGTTPAQKVEEAAAAFGNPGEDNGVVVGFGAANELRDDDGSKSSSDSPDGLVLLATFDMNRLKGEALARAIVHVGSHIANIRGKQNSANNIIEQQAWQTTVLSAVASGQKTLTLLGGYVVWNAAWPAADRGKMVGENIAAFVQNWTPFSN